MTDVLKEQWHLAHDDHITAESGVHVALAEGEVAKRIIRLHNEQLLKDLHGHPYEDIPTMAEFVMSSACDDHYAFMRLWIHGEWAELDRDFPEWKEFVATRNKKAA